MITKPLLRFSIVLLAVTLHFNSCNLVNTDDTDLVLFAVTAATYDVDQQQYLRFNIRCLTHYVEDIEIRLHEPDGDGIISYSGGAGVAYGINQQILVEGVPKQTGEWYILITAKSVTQEKDIRYETVVNVH